jgi:hypothetical protein
MTAPFFITLAAAACLLSASCAALAEPVATLALADQPVRIIRGATVYKAINGTLIQRDDIVETGAAGAQIEIGADSIVALGAQTRLCVAGLGADAKAPAELALLQGWIKVLSKGPTRTLVASAGLQVSVGGGAAIVHSKPGKDELFADEGEQLAARVDEKGKAGAPLKVPSENYAVADAGKPLIVSARPAKPFLGEMPPSFRDRLALAPRSGKAARLAAVKEREVDFADVDAWLRSSLGVRKTFVKRFRGRLADPAFRKQLDQALGQGSEWQSVLYPPVSHPTSQF